MTSKTKRALGAVVAIAVIGGGLGGVAAALAAAGEPLHHPLHLAELGEQVIDLHDRRARAAGDTPLAAGIEFARSGAFIG